MNVSREATLSTAAAHDLTRLRQELEKRFGSAVRPLHATGETRPGFVSTATAVGNSKAVFVRTMNKDGDFAIRPFHLQVVC